MPAFSRSLHLIWGCLWLSIPIGRVLADEYADNLAKWNAIRPAHYQYRYTPGCFCSLTRWQVEAKAGMVVAADKLFGGGTTNPPDLRMFAFDSLFRMIKQLQGEKPYKLAVNYDHEFGFPSGISVDPKQNVSDDEYSISIDQFKVIIPGLTLSRDTVYALTMGDVPGEKKSLALANTGDSALYLNSIEMSLSPTDSFPQSSVALRIHRKPSGNAPEGDSYLRSGMWGSDTIAELGGLLLPPGDTIVFDAFEVDPCFCLLKAGAVISPGLPFTSLLRFNLSHDKSGGASGIRAYAWFRGRYDVTASIESGRIRLRDPAAARSGHHAGVYPAKGRYYGLDGRPPRVDRIPARIHAP